MSRKTAEGKPIVTCPHCNREVVWSTESAWRPFCSKRCKMIDLGAWADESHRIAGEPAMDEANLDSLIDQLERGGGSNK
ncbi:DNA gyrase inhibitor YacG [Kushneria sinocarnis]|nr:DNA gyrase inhibitor YacG [Kushneria sinocarnis]